VAFPRRPVRSQSPHASHIIWRYPSSGTRHPGAPGCAVARLGLPGGFRRVGHGLRNDKRLPGVIITILKLCIYYIIYIYFISQGIPLYVIDMVKRSIAHGRPSRLRYGSPNGIQQVTTLRPRATRRSRHRHRLAPHADKPHVGIELSRDWRDKPNWNKLAPEDLREADVPRD
jgi:hypothetical protein